MVQLTWFQLPGTAAAVAAGLLFRAASGDNLGAILQQLRDIRSMSVLEVTVLAWNSTTQATPWVTGTVAST